MNGKLFFSAKLVTVLAVLFLFPLFSACEQVTGDEEIKRQDGTYEVVTKAQSCGYLLAQITIEDETIVEVDLTEYDNKGREKDKTYEYPIWQDAMAELPDRIIEANSADIDTVSEATRTSERAREAVEKALERSKGKETPFDGTYMGTSEIQDDGWGIALVKVKDGNIDSVMLEEIDENQEFIEDDYSYEVWHEARDYLSQQFEEANSPDVDVYTEATTSSEQWKDAVEDALQNARK